MSDLDDIDFFRSGAVLKDPYPYYEQLRSHCPVHREPHEGVVMVTGYDEALAVYHDVETFSSANSVTGPFPGFSTPLEGDDVTEQIEAQRDARVRPPRVSHRESRRRGCHASGTRRSRPRGRFR